MEPSVEWMIGPLLAAADAAPAENQGLRSVMGLFPIVIMFVLMYFLLIRPQSVKAKQHDALVKALKVGDHIVTSGGIMGIIVSLKEQSVVIRSSDAKFEITKGSVSHRNEKAPGASSS